MAPEAVVLNQHCVWSVLLTNVQKRQPLLCKAFFNPNLNNKARQKITVGWFNTKVVGSLWANLRRKVKKEAARA
jgi:hypothetical protein